MSFAEEVKNELKKNVPVSPHCLLAKETAALYMRGGTAEVDPRIYRKECCKREFLKEAFLAAGTVSTPEKAYHFEIDCRSAGQAELLIRLMEHFSIRARMFRRKNNYIVYLKDGESVANILQVMGAGQAMMNMENTRILKDMRNAINRQVNCDSANAVKVVSASQQQIRDIRLIDEYIGIDKLKPSLREAARARLDNPEVSLEELGTILDPPVGKSGVNHRMREIKKLAAELAGGKE